MVAGVRVSTDEVGQRVRRWRRMATSRGTFPVGEHRLLTTNPDGRMLYVDGADRSVTPSVLSRRWYEPATSRYLMRHVHAGQTVIDIGANIGWHTLLAAERVGPAGCVVSVEPNPRVRQLLHDSVFVNGFWDRCQVLPVALSDQAGETTLHVATSFQGSGRLRPFSKGELAWQGSDEESFTVSLTTLDALAADLGHIDVIKIDVEGHEPVVFDGGHRLLRGGQPLTIVFEYTPTEHVGLLSRLRADGFTIRALTRLGGTRPFDETDGIGDRICCDLVAAR